MTLVELHIPDFNEAKEFYEKLGFVVVWERKPEEFKGYLVMEMENNILCFWAGNEKVYKHPYFKQYPKNQKKGYGVEIVLMIKDVESYSNRVKNFAKVVEPLKL